MNGLEAVADAIMSSCHPARKIFANGLCHSCANVKWRKHNAEAWARHLEQNRKWGRSERGKLLKRISHYRRKYGISIEQFNAMLLAQKNSCAICKIPFGDKTPYLDHCHKTQKVRGLLCYSCNVGVAFIEKHGFVDAARRYLCP